VYKLETDPDYYFLGEIMKGRVVSGLDTTGALLTAFTQLIERHESEYGSLKGAPPNPGDTLPPPEELYVREVRAGTIRELARLNDERAIPVLIKLLDHPAWLVRRHAVEALGAMRAQESRAAIEHAAEHDAYQSVREAAKVTLANLQPL
jgi:HEAT repeat protein